MSRSFTSRRLATLVVVSVVAVTGAVVWGVKAWQPPSSAAGTTQQSTGAGSGSGTAGQGLVGGLSVYPVKSRPRAPAVAGTTLDGTRLSLADMTGHLVVLNAWGSWCGPCRGEAPILARVARESAGRGVRFLGIDTRDTSGAAKAFERYFKVPYPSIVDTDGRVLLALKDFIPISGVPSTLLVDRAGRVAARIVGPTDYSTLHGLIHDELGRKSTAAPASSGTNG